MSDLAVLEAENPVATLIGRYRFDRPGFVREVLGVEPDAWQEGVLRALDRGECYFSIRSCVGAGKSALAAWIILHMLLTTYPVKIVVTAPSYPQLFDALAAEVKLWRSRLPDVLRDLLETRGDRVTLKADPDAGFVSFRTARLDQPEIMQGIHCENVMFLADEASGIPEPIMDAARGILTTKGAILFLIGNPLRSSGTFFRTHNEWRDQWWTKKVTAFDCPRIDPEFIQKMKDEYGEESAAYQARVLGEFPRADEDTLIARSLVEDAAARDVEELETTPIYWGLDVGRTGDRSVLVKRQGRVMLDSPLRMSVPDLMQVVGRIVAERDRAHNQLPEAILVDSIGLGAGVADRLRELKAVNRWSTDIIDVNVAETASMSDRYTRLRDELWDKARQWFAAKDCRIVHDGHLVDELCATRATYTSTGKLKVESKEEMKRRGLKSPDTADAFNLTFAREAAIGAGRIAGHLWSKPLRRNIGGIA